MLRIPFAVQLDQNHLWYFVTHTPAHQGKFNTFLFKLSPVYFSSSFFITLQFVLTNDLEGNDQELKANYITRSDKNFLEKEKDFTVNFPPLLVLLFMDFLSFIGFKLCICLLFFFPFFFLGGLLMTGVHAVVFVDVDIGNV